MGVMAKDVVQSTRSANLLKNRKCSPTYGKHFTALDVDFKASVGELLRWFEKAGRSFPWRFGRDPYAILVAEKLLQQTAARSAIIKAYCDLLSEYPTPAELASADIRTLKKVMQPLGLTYRATELRALGQSLMSKFGGNVPRNLRDLMSLPGVGDYAARAVLSFGFEENIAVVDTNVARFLYRFFGIRDPFPANPARKKNLIELAERLLPKGQSRDFNFAILDLCATICRPVRPLCEQCPVKFSCVYAQANPSRKACSRVKRKP